MFVKSQNQTFRKSFVNILKYLPVLKIGMRMTPRYSWNTAKVGVKNQSIGGRRDRDGMVVRFTTTCAISVYHH
jgi:hypothetical protein